MTYDLVQGWTSPIDIALLTRGAVSSVSTAGFTVAVVLKDLQGNAVDTSGDCAFTDSTSWIARWTPDAADLVPGVFRLRVKVTDGSGGIAYFPSSEPDVLVVRAET